MGINRRSFLKGAAAAGGAALLPQAALAQDAFSNLTQAIVRGINECLRYRIVGFFVTPYGDPYVIISHFLPVGLIEITRAPGDSIFFPSGSHIIGTIGQGVTGFRSEGNYEARVWVIKKRLRQLLTAGLSDCFFCDDPRDSGVDTSQLTSLINQANGQGSSGPLGGAETLPGAVCEAGAEEITEQLSGFLNEAFGDYLELAYDSVLDGVNWRSGCRDTGAALANTPATILKCPTLGSHIGGPWGDDLCIGRWGPLLPRQMRFNSTPNAAPIGLAYRALHIAHHTLNSFVWTVDRQQLVQMMHPRVTSNCLHPGANTIELDLTMRMSGLGDRGNYGYVWWVQTFCAKPVRDFVSCF
ncbi:twin-arginine translocation signal domain-containing protein (plasmid) [Flagellatimonas centrodinii]|uniref:twin-arginine translocation signal domain-containing protein n=1 Tax=Flagellatimonas centrodinii TaxID=2806210 RepID=UPI001FF042F8|nr:twin-arginine translocation signal domain-containing protein [Flagellatimonas centrodinii]ULQ48414.1 twin-arginine translocation signal domain-containing protein [Flagellatimonas centrodinii]